MGDGLLHLQRTEFALDLVVLLLLLFYAYRGWRKGILRSLIGPVSLIICGLIGIIHYDLNKNMITSLSIAIGGTFVLTIILSIILDTELADIFKSLVSSSIISPAYCLEFTNNSPERYTEISKPLSIPLSYLFKLGKKVFVFFITDIWS